MSSRIHTELEAPPIRRLAERVRSFLCLWQAIKPLLGHKPWNLILSDATAHTGRMLGPMVGNDARTGMAQRSIFFQLANNCHDKPLQLAALLACFGSG
jgi:hypothetical protein